MMDNAAGSLRGGALELSETLGIKVCTHALEWHIESAYSVSFEAVWFEMFLGTLLLFLFTSHTAAS